MTSPEKTREVAHNYIRATEARDYKSLVEFWTEQGIYWLSGPDTVPWSGPKLGLERIAELLNTFETFATLKVDINNTVVEKNKALVECRIHAVNKVGIEYKQDIVFSFELDSDGKIVLLREYIESMKTLAYFEAAKAEGEKRKS